LDFFWKYRLEDVGPTRARLAELIGIFDARRHELTTRELEELRTEIETLTERVRDEQREP
jgi:hypothetical protein